MGCCENGRKAIKKARNATYISRNEVRKISKEIQKLEKQMIVRSTICNDRSSQSHCMIILDVPTVGRHQMLVDIKGSKNIDQVGLMGFEAKNADSKDQPRKHRIKNSG